MANRRLIKFYKGVLLVQLQTKINEDGGGVDIEEVDTLLKSRVEIDMSCVQMSNLELHAVILTGFKLADEIGLVIDYPQDKLDKLIKLNI